MKLFEITSIGYFDEVGVMVAARSMREAFHHAKHNENIRGGEEREIKIKQIPAVEFDADDTRTIERHYHEYINF